MYLKSIKASGFKSFADKTNLMLEKNITCIVGPNGSGKSNIVDAIRWVLGEQSVKSLRGTNAMSDVIFAGSKSRKEATRAEVSLTFDNKDKYLKSDFAEIEVKRVLYRTGESEYFINGSHVRLKDITDLFIDTGAGSDSINIISQGSIESIVNSKPLERRAIFEEAASVLKYKRRKEESLRKLDKTKENMDKIILVIEELKTNLEPLRMQSENAQKYLELKEELKNIEIATMTSEITQINEEYARLQKEIDSINALLVEEETGANEEAGQLETLKLKNIRLDDLISETNKKLLDMTSKLVNLQNEKMRYTERKKLSGESKEVSNNIITLKEEILEYDQEIHVLENELRSLNDLLKKQTHELADINEEESFIKIKKNTATNKYQKNVHELFSLKSKAEVLENAIANDTKMPSSVKNVLNNIRLKGIKNTIGKLITVPSEFARAIEVALGASANFIVVENDEAASNAISFLKDNKLGRATFFPLNIIKERNLPQNILEEGKNWNGFIGLASDLITFEKQYENVIKNQLGNVLIVSDLVALKEIGKKLEYKYRIVSLDGEIMHTGGSLTGGMQKSDSNIIQDKMILEQTKREIVEKEEENKSVIKELEELESKLTDLQKKEEDLNRSNISIKETVTEKTNHLENKMLKQANLNKELEGSQALVDGNVDQKLLALMEETNEVEIQKNKIESDLEEQKEEKNMLLSKIEILEKQYREKNTNYNRLQSELKGKEILLGKLDTRLDNLLLALNENYNLTYENAKISYILEMEEEVAKAKVVFLKNEIYKLGDVNVFSIEEYERVSTRYNFLNTQKEDLEKASVNLLNIIEEMDIIMIEKFQETFTKISEEFKKVFKKLFKGGNGLLKLTDPENILETGIEIVAEPPGKKLNSIGLLSGGEKTLTAISLLFAIMNVKTVPFCILDEVEAALDEANVDAFGKYLQEYKENSQFILITHKKRTMEYADILYGITMQESGVSKIVSVKLENIG